MNMDNNEQSSKMKPIPNVVDVFYDVLERTRATHSWHDARTKLVWF